MSSTSSKVYKYKPNTNETVNQCLGRLNQLMFYNNALLEIAELINSTVQFPDISNIQLARRLKRKLKDIPINYKDSLTILGKAHYKPSRPQESWIQITTAPMNITTYIDTLYHEIAHIIKNIYFPRTKPHGPEWMSIAIILGASPLPTGRLIDDSLLTDNYNSKTKPTARCPNCSYTYYRIKYRKDYWKNKHCHKCNTVLQTANWSQNGKLIFWNPLNA